MEILLLVGGTIFIGTLCGKFFQHLKIPQVTGYIVVGVILGNLPFPVWTPQIIDLFDPLVELSLGIIGFLIGAELKFDIFRKRGRSIYTILFSEGIMTFLVVGAAITFFTGKLYLGLLFGALASATAPASTVDVLWENKTRGPLTTTLLAIVALDDVLALLIYAFAGLFARGLIVHEQFAWIQLFHSLLEVGLGLLIGITGGLMLYWLIHFIKDRERILPFSFGVIALTVGVASHYKIDLILSSMLMGLTLANVTPVESKEIFETIRKAISPIYVLFFVLVGARLDLSLFLGSGITIMAVVYVISRSLGKLSGAMIGGILGGAPAVVSRYLGMCLFAQAGVAIGLAISIHQNLSHISPEAEQIGLTIVNVVVATTFIVQLIGPPCVKFAVTRANEVGRNVTEDDIIESYKVADLLEKDVPIIREDTPLNAMVDMVKTSESYDFCVVDHRQRLLGSISIGDLRAILLEREADLNQLVLAKDIAVPNTRVIVANRPLKEAIDILRLKELDFLPVVKNEQTRELIGLIHYRYVMREIQKELLVRRG